MAARFKDFLESSTIHGLNYISTSKKYLLKFFWICVVLGGVSTAVYLIGKSFSSWKESPILTSIETFPIKEAKFPRVTVCPPLGSNTAFNQDLMKAHNNTLDKSVRLELVDLAEEWLQDNAFKEIYKLEDSFREKDKYKNWYQSYTNVLLPKPRSKSKRHSVMFHTAATYGFVKTPWFGENFTFENFQLKLDYRYYIYPSYKLLEYHPNASLVLKISIDTKETVGGVEVVEFTAPRRSMEKLVGKTNEQRKYRVDSIKGYNPKIIIKFLRDSNQQITDQWSNKRMTGYSVEWYYESENGSKLEITPDKKVHEAASRNMENESFVKLMNIIYYAISIKGYTENEIFHIIKRVKVDWVKQVKDFGQVSNSLFVKIKEYYLMDLLTAIENVLQLNQSLPTTDIYTNEFTNSLLEAGHETYLYLANCPQRETPIIRKWYADFFLNASTRDIVEVVLNVFKHDERNGLKWHTFENNAATKLFEKLVKYLHLDVQKVGHLLSPNINPIGSSTFLNSCNGLDSCSDFPGKSEMT